MTGDLAHANLDLAFVGLACHLKITAIEGNIHGREKQRVMGLRGEIILVTAGIELRDVEDTLFTHDDILHVVVGLLNGSSERALLDIDLFVDALLSVHEFNGRALGNVEGRRAVSGLNLELAGHALGVESNLRALADLDQTVDLGRLTKVDRGGSFAFELDVNGRSAFARLDQTVVVEDDVLRILDENAVTVLAFGNVTHDDGAVVGRNGTHGLSTAAEFHADALLFHNDRAGVFNRSRSVAANAHAVGVLDDDLACIHGLGIVLGKDRFIFPLDAILVGRDVDLALVGEFNAFALDFKTGGVCILARGGYPKLASEFALFLGEGREGALAGVILVVVLTISLDVGPVDLLVGRDDAFCRHFDPFGDGRVNVRRRGDFRSGHGGTGHKRHGGRDHRLRALGLHGRRHFIDDHQGTSCLVEHNLKTLVHVLPFRKEVLLKPFSCS